MKKILFGMVALVMLAMMTGTQSSCTRCDKGAQEARKAESETTMYHDYNGVAQDFTVGVSHIQALHHQTVYSTLGVQKFEWRNSKVIFNNEITLEKIDSLKITDVNDVFYYWNNGPWVQYVNSNVENGTQIPRPIQDVWIEDADLNSASIELSAEDVLWRIKEWNGLLPKGSKSMSLRLPVGPCKCNPQWVLGNTVDVIFVDAVTGEISNWNPAFNPQRGVKGGDFGKPLGEWP